jgi:hypothetical protein
MEMDTQDRDENYQVLLNEFDQAVRTYEMNPNFLGNVNAVKNVYRNYIFSKGKIELSEENKKRESDLIKRCGGLLK